jgi:glutaminyl-peptide cyclotransferase
MPRLRAAFLFSTGLALLLSACGNEAGSPPAPDAETAIAFAQGFVRRAPASAGTPEAAEMAKWIVSEAEKNPAARVSVMEFSDMTPAGPKVFRNVVAEIPGKKKDFVIVGAHYDTKHFDSFAFIGANDGASGVAALLSMIRALDGVVPPLGLRFIFFDGEEALFRYSSGDGLHGSRHAAEVWAADRSLERCRAMILLDMVGDRELCLTLPADTPPELRRLAGESAEAAGKASCISDYPHEMIDDHVPFRDRGVPAIDLIDFQYGPGNSFWHTPQDTLENISGESIAAAARIAMTMIWRLAEVKK